MTTKALPAGWKRVRSGWQLYYERTDGARVYQYTARSNWGGRVWGAWAPGLPAGGSVGSSRAEAIRWVERHYPAALAA